MPKKKLKRKKKNPRLPLTDYLIGLNNVVIYKNLTPENKIILFNAFSKPNHSEFRIVKSELVHEGQTIPLTIAYFITKYDKLRKYIVGVLEDYPDELEWHDFHNVIEKIKISDADRQKIKQFILKNLQTNYIRNIEADVNIIISKIKSDTLDLGFSKPEEQEEIKSVPTKSTSVIVRKKKL